MLGVVPSHPQKHETQPTVMQKQGAGRQKRYLEQSSSMKPLIHGVSGSKNQIGDQRRPQATESDGDDKPLNVDSVSSRLSALLKTPWGQGRRRQIQHFSMGI